MFRYALLGLLFSLSIFAETESERFLRLSCEENSAQACLLLGRVLQEENPERSNELFQMACDLGKCSDGFNKKVVNTPDPQPSIEDKEEIKPQQANARRSIASVDPCVDLMRALSQCRSYRCKAKHPLVSEYQVIHHILRKDENCQYTQWLPNDKVLECTLTDEQTEKFESLSQLSAFSHIDELVSRNVCRYREASQ